MRIALGCVVLVGCSAAPQAPAPSPEIVLEEHPKRVVRWVDPATGRDAHPGRARSGPRGIAALPTKEAGFFADLGALAALERSGRWLVRPMAPGPHMGAGWYQNRVRTTDGKMVAVLDAKRAPDPNDGPLGADPHLLLARGDPPKLFADVPMRTTKWGPWQTIAILDERFAAAGWGWTLTVVDLQAGELRATVDTEESRGTCRAGEFHDLSRARAVDRSADARADPGFLPGGTNRLRHTKRNESPDTASGTRWFLTWSFPAPWPRSPRNAGAGRSR